jgi:squalene-hopene/tetraprenyl-beta-curcumene cyclase
VSEYQTGHICLEEENMRIRTQGLVVGAAFLLGACLLLRADDAVTAENAVDPGPNRADEPLREKFSLPDAVRFLDAVALTWHKQHNCFACHSDYVFLLARPAVNPKASAHTTIRQALEHLAENPRQTDYGSTEAVMVAAILAQNDAATGKLHPATRKALDQIWTLQREDGGWTWMKNNEPPSEVDDHYGVTMAAIGVGVAPDGYSKTPAAQKGLEKIRQYLRNNPPANMHQRAMMLLASLQVDGIMTETERGQVVAGLFALQKPDGGWGLATLGHWKRSDGKEQDYESSDGYGTGFVLYVLRSAGTAAEDSRIRKGIAWLKTHQRASGRWFTRSLTRDNTHLLTPPGTAYAVLALALCGEAEHPD